MTSKIHLTANFVPYGVHNRWFSNAKNVEITFFQQETSFSSEQYERNISEKILDVCLGNVYLWCKFQNFSLKSRQMKK